MYLLSLNKNCQTKYQSNCVFKEVHSKSSNVVCKVFIVNHINNLQFSIPHEVTKSVLNPKKSSLFRGLHEYHVTFDELLKETRHGITLTKKSNCNY